MVLADTNVPEAFRKDNGVVLTADTFDDLVLCPSAITQKIDFDLDRGGLLGDQVQHLAIEPREEKGI